MKKIPVFCFRCGIIGHGEAQCSKPGNHTHAHSSMPSSTPIDVLVMNETSMNIDGVGLEHCSFQNTDSIEKDPVEINFLGENDLGPWLIVHRRRAFRGETRWRFSTSWTPEG